MKKVILSLISLLFIPLFASASIDTNLYYGLQQNSDVIQLQEFLIDKGFLDSGNTTGNFFSLTLKAVKDYQTSAGISSTGYVGTLTRKAINDDLDKNLSGSNTEATTETGTTPTITPPATTNDVSTLLQAIMKLLQERQAAETQQNTTLQQTINQVAQNTQQTVVNTTPAPVVEEPKTVGTSLPVFNFTPRIINWSSEVRFRIEQQTFDSCELAITGENTNYKNSIWKDSGAQVLQGVSYFEGKEIRINLVSAYVDSNTLVRFKTYNYSITCKKTGYQDSIVSGIITTDK